MRIEATNFHPRLKNTLRGFTDLTVVDCGLCLHDCYVHCKEGRWWVGLPAKSRTDKDGVQHWHRVVEFASKEDHAVFQAAALEALRRSFSVIFSGEPAPVGGAS